MILVIDNYDSFTYNLVDLIAQYTEVMVLYPNDPVVLQQQVDAVIISPGPGHPLDNDTLMTIINHYQDKPILGICLGAQALTCYYSGHVIQGQKVMHGKVDSIAVNTTYRSKLYQGIPERLKVMRYHSLISDPFTFPKMLTITAETKDCIQSFEHQTAKHYGIQYHPESFATEYGTQIIKNFINLI